MQSGVSEILSNNENGLLFSVGKPQAAVDLIVELDHDRNRLHTLRQAARALGEQNSVRITMVEFEKRLQQILNEPIPKGVWENWSPLGNPGRNWKERLAYKLPRPWLRWIGYQS